MQNIGFIVISVYVIYLLIRSILNILTGLGKITNAFVTSEEQKKQLLKKGIIGLIGTALGGGVFITLFLLIIL